MFFVKTSDGVKIAVYDYQPQCENTVFLVHGWPLSHKIYEYQINLLTQCGYRVVAIDLRGFGRSDSPACGYSYDRMASDIHDVVRTMGLDNLILTGFSMGGAIDLRYMRLFKGEGVSKLILLSAAAPSWVKRPGFPFGLDRSQVDQLLQLASTDRPQLAYHFSHKQLFATPKSDAVKNWFEDIALSASGIGTLQTGYSLRDEDGRQDLACVCVPTRIIYGKKDVVVTAGLIQAQHKGIKGSQLMTLPNSGHGIMYDELALFNECFLKAIRN